MKSIILVAALLSFYGTSAFAIGEVIYSCSADDGVGFSFPIRRGNSNPKLIIRTHSSQIHYGAEQYQVDIWDGEILDPSSVLILDVGGERLIEKKENKLIDSEGNEHQITACFVDA